MRRIKRSRGYFRTQRTRKISERMERARRIGLVILDQDKGRLNKSSLSCIVRLVA